MTPSPILRRALAPFAHTSDHFHLQTPNRFAAPIRERRKGSLRSTVQKDAYWVVGTLPQRFEHCGSFSMNALMRGSLECVIDEVPLPDMTRVHSGDPLLRFTLKAEEMEHLLKAARILKSTHFSVAADGETVRVSAFCRDTSNSHWFEPSYLKHGIKKFKVIPGRTHVPALKWDARNTFALRVPAEVIAPVQRSFGAGVRKLLVAEDYEVTIHATHAVEMMSIESGLAVIAATVPA